jgi:hypothetical protein
LPQKKVVRIQEFGHICLKFTIIFSRKQQKQGYIKCIKYHKAFYALTNQLTFINEITHTIFNLSLHYYSIVRNKHIPI